MRSKQSNVSMGMDQAEGLRRLLVHGHPQVITVLAGKPGVGRTATITNLATAIAHCGKRVLVLDENRLATNVQVRQGKITRYDLLDVAQEKCKLRDALFNQCGFAVLSTKRVLNSLAQMKQIEKLRLENALVELGEGIDVMLVDAAMPNLIKPPAIRLAYQKSIISSLVMSQAEISDDLAGGSSLLLVVDATASGITDSYALMKRLAQENSCLKFEIVVNKVGDEQVALKIFGNMAKVASRNLDAQLVYLGRIPFDEKLKRATQLGRSVIDVFPAADSTKSYIGLCKKILWLDKHANESASGAGNFIQNLLRQVSQPLRQDNNSSTNAYV